MDNLTTDDLKRIKREHARGYVRERLVLRTMVNLGLLSAEEVRAQRHRMTQHLAAWRLTRGELKHG